MPVTQSSIRVILRWLHITLGLVILGYIYSPWGSHHIFQTLVKWVVIPVITFSGIWIWKFKEFNKIFRIR